jgi:hypothetical protein
LAVAFGIELTVPVEPSTVPELVHFLEARGLQRGIGDYWSASITTVMSDGKVSVRPVVTDLSGKVVRFDWQSSGRWYSGRSFQFLVYSTVTPSNIDLAIAAATFGSVEHIYTVGPYKVLLWSHPLAVAA